MKPNNAFENGRAQASLRPFARAVQRERKAAQTMPVHVLRALALTAAFAVCAAGAAPPAAPVRQEIEALLGALSSSGCQFNRNGSWYSGAEAQAHLIRKLEYLESKGLVKSAEDFINLGASGSSTSGKAYLVRCGTAQPVESKQWLEQRLAVIRKSQ